MAEYLTRFAARLLRSTHYIDRTYQRFDRLRSMLVLAMASDRFIETYSKLAYDASPTFRAGSPTFRPGLFAWEERAVGQFFPPPPGRVLVGGAGGGREPFAFVERGYSVVAFDPAPALAASMQDAAGNFPPGRLQAYCASYADLPVMPRTPTRDPFDLRTVASFDAAVFGWSSFSHICDDDSRVSALSRVAALTRGPILVSYFSQQQSTYAPPRRGFMSSLRRRASRRGASMFTTGVGYARLLTVQELAAMASRAGLHVVHTDSESEWPHAILTSPLTPAQPGT